MILLIDNFDSFTHNIVHAYQQLGVKVIVRRNHAMTIATINQLAPDLIVIGPGPGYPNRAGISLAAIGLGEKGISIFGICLGHQAIGEFFGAKIVQAKRPLHGKTSPIFHSEEEPFTGLPQGFAATRYHSLLIEPLSLPSCLQVTAWTKEGEIMGIKHRHFPIAGVQFHPESIATEMGLDLLKNTVQSEAFTF